MKQADIRRIEEILNEEFERCHLWECHNGNPSAPQFTATNANYNRYVGMLEMLVLMGYEWKRINGIHTIYKA